MGELGEGDGPAMMALKPSNGQLVVGVTQLVLNKLRLSSSFGSSGRFRVATHVTAETWQFIKSTVLDGHSLYI